MPGPGAPAGGAAVNNIRPVHSVESLFKFVDALGLLADSVGDFAAGEPVELGEGGFEVGCGGVEARLVEEAPASGLAGLDSQSSMVRFEAADVYVVTGALVGPEVSVVPGGAEARWLGLRLRFKAGGGLAEALESAVGGLALVRSGVTGRLFDGTYNEEAVRDEVRTEVETALLGRWRGGGLLLLDGPIFPTPRVLAMEGNPYAELYRGLVRRRVEAARGVKAVGVVKRVGMSTYYARCRGLGVDDDTLVKNEASRLFGRRGAFAAVVGPVEIRAGGFAKYCWYAAAGVGRDLHVVRVEGLDPELAERGAEAVAAVMGPGGAPLPIALADRIARRLNGGVVRLLAGLSPLRLTYEGLEAVGRALEAP